MILRGNPATVIHGGILKGKLRARARTGMDVEIVERKRNYDNLTNLKDQKQAEIPTNEAKNKNLKKICKTETFWKNQAILEHSKTKDFGNSCEKAKSNATQKR